MPEREIRNKVDRKVPNTVARIIYIQEWRPINFYYNKSRREAKPKFDLNV